MNYPDEVDHDLTDVTGMMCFTSGIPEVAVSDFQVSESLYTIQIYWNNTIQIMPDYNILSIIISQMMLDDTRTIQIYPIYWGLRPPQAVKNQILSFYSFSGLVSTVTSCKPRGVNRLRWPNHRLSASFRYAAG